MFFTFCKTSIEQAFWGFVAINPLETSTPLGNCYVHNPCSLSVQASQTLNASGLSKRDHEKKPHFLKMRVNQGRMSEINLHRHAQLHTGFYRATLGCSIMLSPAALAGDVKEASNTICPHLMVLLVLAFKFHITTISLKSKVSPMLTAIQNISPWPCRYIWIHLEYSAYKNNTQNMSKTRCKSASPRSLNKVNVILNGNDTEVWLKEVQM